MIKSIDQNAFARDATLVFSGRASPGKNHGLWIKVAHEIQAKSRRCVRVVICGPQTAWLREASPFPTEIRRFRWRVKPRFLGDLGLDWPRKIKGNPVLLNLSTSFQEDFGVSAAQAQQQGWPLMLSDWGGHADIEGAGCLKIPCGPIFARDAAAIAALCLAPRDSRPRGAMPESGASRPPRAVEYGEIEGTILRMSPTKRDALEKCFGGDARGFRAASRKWRAEIERALAGS
jgi:glycosyltransferase involved in cell wall biosynthesis